METITNKSIKKQFLKMIMEQEQSFIATEVNADKKRKCYRDYILTLCRSYGMSRKDLLKIDEALNNIECIRDELFFDLGYKTAAKA